MRKILVAIDGSGCASRAIKYAGEQFSGMRDLSLTLLHVLPSLPPRFWDDGHLLSKEEKEERQAVVARWIENQMLVTEPMFQSAVEDLTQRGIQSEQIERKIIYDSTDAATSILEEARDGGYLTLVLGRCGFYRIGERLIGSTASSIIQRGAGLAICVVE
ncbi:MAG TPA: universal stress protein [Syntrophorhabdales bacterium]|nr:universal stress protein [Syntrophorhabdales bacterium]